MELRGQPGGVYQAGRLIFSPPANGYSKFNTLLRLLVMMETAQGRSEARK